MQTALNSMQPGDATSQRKTDKTTNIGHPCTYCPNCSANLESSRCKLLCLNCGYYMSCADYY